MEQKTITMRVDSQNGIKYISLSNKEVKRSVSIADGGVEFLSKIGGDIVLDIDGGGNLVGIELLGIE